MIFYLCIALNINILLSSELCWCETTTFFTLLTSHIINRHPTFIHVRPPGVPNEYQQHIYRAPCDCNTLGQMGEVSVRTMEDPSQRIVVCFFASNAERIATEKKIYISPYLFPVLFVQQHCATTVSSTRYFCSFCWLFFSFPFCLVTTFSICFVQTQLHTG